MSCPRYLLHEGHLQLTLLKPINTAITITCAPKRAFLENSPSIAESLWSIARNNTRVTPLNLCRILQGYDRNIDLDPYDSCRYYEQAGQMLYCTVRMGDVVANLICIEGIS